MGIIDDYLTGSSEKVEAPKVSSQLINSFLPSQPTINDSVLVPAGAPINGKVEYITKEEAKKRASGERINPRPGIESIPLKAGMSVYDAAKEGILTAGSGIGDILTNKPAQGAGKIGTGLLSAITSPLEAASSIAGDITGSKDIANKAGFVVGALPVSSASKTAIVKQLPKNKAFSELVDKITSGGRDQQALIDTVNAMKADSRIGPADISPAVLNMTQKLFTTEGDAAKNYLYNVSKGRMEKLSADVHKAYDEAAGVPVNAVQKLADLAQASKDVGDKLINTSLAKAKGPADISKTLEAIDDVLKPGALKIGDSVPLTNVKKELESIREDLRMSKEYDVNDLNKFQSGLRVTGQKLLRSANAGDHAVGEAMLTVRKNLINDIEKVAPGYRDALNAYREEKHIGDAFREGYQSSAKGIEKDPAFTEKWFNKLTDAEKEAAREGKRLSISHKMGQSENPSLAGTKAARSEFNKKELEIFFGKEGTEKLLRDLENTRAIKNTDQKIIEGSQTQMRAAGDKAIELPVKKEDANAINKYALPIAVTAAEAMTGQTGMAGLALSGLAAAHKIGSSVAFKAKTAIAKERNLQLAKMALPTEGPSRDLLIQQLEAAITGPKKSMLSRLSSGLPTP